MCVRKMSIIPSSTNQNTKVKIYDINNAFLEIGPSFIRKRLIEQISNINIANLKFSKRLEWVLVHVKIKTEAKDSLPKGIYQVNIKK